MVFVLFSLDSVELKVAGSLVLLSFVQKERGYGMDPTIPLLLFIASASVVCASVEYNLSNIGSVIGVGDTQPIMSNSGYNSLLIPSVPRVLVTWVSSTSSKCVGRYVEDDLGQPIPGDPFDIMDVGNSDQVPKMALLSNGQVVVVVRVNGSPFFIAGTWLNPTAKTLLFQKTFVTSSTLSTLDVVATPNGFAVAYGPEPFVVFYDNSGVNTSAPTPFHDASCTESNNYAVAWLNTSEELVVVADCYTGNNNIQFRRFKENGTKVDVDGSSRILFGSFSWTHRASVCSLNDRVIVVSETSARFITSSEVSSVVNIGGSGFFVPSTITPEIFGLVGHTGSGYEATLFNRSMKAVSNTLSVSATCVTDSRYAFPQLAKTCCGKLLLTYSKCESGSNPLDFSEPVVKAQFLNSTEIPCAVSNDCNNHATTVNGTLVSGCACSCSAGYGGPTCNQCADQYENYPSCPEIPCTVGNDCNNHATAVNGTLVTGCTCSCSAGYGGPTCNRCADQYENYPSCTEIPCTASNDCNNHATAVNGTLVTGCTCSCSAGYGGPTCNRCADQYENYPSCTEIPCTASNDCNNHATAVNGTLVSGCACTCATRYDGAQCNICKSFYENYPACSAVACTASNDCSNHSTSVAGNVSSGCNCSCASGFAGAQCNRCAKYYDGYPFCSTVSFTPTTSSSTSNSVSSSGSVLSTSESTSSSTVRSLSPTSGITRTDSYATRASPSRFASGTSSLRPTTTMSRSLALVNVTLVGPFSELWVSAMWDNASAPALLLLLSGDEFLLSPRCQHCAVFTGSGRATQEYAAGNISLRIVNRSVASIEIKSQPLVSLNAAEVISVHVLSCCMATNRPLPPINVTVLPLPAPVPLISAKVMEATRAVGGSSAIASGAVGAPVGAAQAARTTLILNMAACEPSFDELDWMQSPTQVRFGSEDTAMHAGAAVMNIVVVVAFAGVLIVCAAVHRMCTADTFSESLAWARFPSLLAVPVMLLLEPTVMCCCTLLWHGSNSMRAVGCLCLAACIAAPIGVWWFMRPKCFFAVFVSGITDEVSRDSAIETVRPTQRILHKLSQIFESECDWKDDPEHSGFCRRHRLLFCDYKDGCHRFLVVETMMCIATGILEGSQSGGSGQCLGLLTGLVVVFVIYTAVILWKRPYNVLYVLAFSAVTSVLQTVSATCMLIYTASGASVAFDIVQTLSLLLLYLLFFNLLVSVYPRLRMVVDSVCRKVSFAWGKSKSKVAELLENSRGSTVHLEQVDLQTRLLSIVELETIARIEAGEAQRGEPLASDFDELNGPPSTSLQIVSDLPSQSTVHNADNLSDLLDDILGVSRTQPAAPPNSVAAELATPAPIDADDMGIGLADTSNDVDELEDTGEASATNPLRRLKRLSLEQKTNVSKVSPPALNA